MAEHAPRYIYDCKRCKFAWNCGPVCSCGIRRDGLPRPPRKRALQVAQGLVRWRASRGYEPTLDKSEQVELFGEKGKPFVEDRSDFPTVWDRVS